MKMLLIVTALVTAQVGATELRGISSRDLLTAYWLCFDKDEEANKGTGWNEADLAACAAISKEVQRRHFDDDFGKLHEWTKANRKARTLL